MNSINLTELKNIINLPSLAFYSKKYSLIIHIYSCDLQTVYFIYGLQFYVQRYFI
jgi:hypothetical protein